jgi:hypothetical protein
MHEGPGSEGSRLTGVFGVAGKESSGMGRAQGLPGGRLPNLVLYAVNATLAVLVVSLLQGVAQAEQVWVGVLFLWEGGGACMHRNMHSYDPHSMCVRPFGDAWPQAALVKQAIFLIHARLTPRVPPIHPSCVPAGNVLPLLPALPPHAGHALVLGG